MSEPFTAGARRALDRAQGIARRRGATATEPVDLLIALAHEAESRAAELLAEYGFVVATAVERLGLAGIEEEPAPVEDHDATWPAHDLPHSPEFRATLNDATVR